MKPPRKCRTLGNMTVLFDTSLVRLITFFYLYFVTFYNNSCRCVMNPTNKKKKKSTTE
jgi:hypothetical protein